MSSEKLLSISNIIQPEGRQPYGFAVDMESGDPVFIHGGLLTSQDITEEDIGQQFYGFVLGSPNGHDKAARLGAFIRWAEDDEDEAPMTETEIIVRSAPQHAKELGNIKSRLLAHAGMLQLQIEASDRLTTALNEQRSSVLSQIEEIDALI